MKPKIKIGSKTYLCSADELPKAGDRVIVSTPHDLPHIRIVHSYDPDGYWKVIFNPNDPDYGRTHWGITPVHDEFLGCGKIIQEWD